MKKALILLIGFCVLLTTLPLRGETAPRSLPDERALRAAVALGMGMDPGAFARTLDQPPAAADPDLSLRLRSALAPQRQDSAVRNGPAAARLIQKTGGPGAWCASSVQGAVSGRVYDIQGNPVEAITVELIPEGWMDPAMQFGLMPYYSYQGVSGPDGSFSVAFDEPGTYRVLARDPLSRHLAQYHDHASTWETAAVLPLVGGQTVTGLTFHLPPAASIAGRAADAASGEGIWGLQVFAYSLDEVPWDAAEAWWPAMATTDAGGAYRLEGLKPGAYEIQIYDLGNFYAPAVHASMVEVEEGQAVTGINFALAASSTGITGTITTPAGEPVSGGWVFASTFTEFESFTAITDPQGRFRLGVGPGSYFVKAGDASGDYLPTYYPGVRFSSDAVKVTVTDGAVEEGVDFPLLQAAKIAGRVVADPDGAPLPQIFVQAFDAWGHWRGDAATTDGEGNFTIGGLDPGPYRIFAWDWSGLRAPEWYEDKADYASADPVTAVAGQVTGGVEMRLGRSGSISGTVTDGATGLPLSGVSLFAWSADRSGTAMGWGESGADGTYSIPGLTTGRYILYAYDYAGGHLPTYYDGVTELALATPVAVTTGVDTGGIVMRMAAGGSIAGHVRDARNGAPLTYAFVTAFDPEGNWTGYAFADGEGAYAVTGLSAGSYRLYAQEGSGAFAPKWYPNADRFEDAAPVAVQSGSAVTGINFALPPAGSISGRVTDPAGAPLAWLTLFAEKLDGSRVVVEQFWGSTDEEGRYTIIGLGSGNYRVGLLLWNGLVLYYGGTTDPNQAVPVPVVQGQATAGIDFSVGTGGGVRGKVTDAVTGQPVAFAEVWVMDGLGMVVSWGASKSDGTYEALWLPAGNYKAMALAPCYKEEWFREASSFETAEWVRVANNAVTSGVDFTLTPLAGCGP